MLKIYVTTIILFGAMVVLGCGTYVSEAEALETIQSIRAVK